MNWFKTYRSVYSAPRIDAVEIEKFSDSSVWVEGRRRARISTYDCYFPTWEEARDILMHDAEVELNHARRRLERAQGYHGNVKGMKP